MDVAYPGFQDVNGDLVHTTKCALANYVKGLAGSLAGDVEDEDPAIRLHANVQVNTDADGWPILVETAWDDLSKHDLEVIVRSYLGKHYSMCFFDISAR